MKLIAFLFNLLLQDFSFDFKLHLIEPAKMLSIH